MDPLLARRLETDKAFRDKLATLTKRYIKLGVDTLSYWMDDFDYAYDMLMCFAPLTKSDFEALEKGHPRRFILPTSTTQIATMTTYIAQSLFGQESPHKVDARGPDDEVPAEFVNQLLRWNAEQQPTYYLGYLWVQDCLTANRGIFYNSWAPMWSTAIVNTPQSLPELDGQGQPVIDEETGEPKVTQYFRPTRKRTNVGGYSRYDLVSPYDFICDPSLPLSRLQEMRFCGHKVLTPFVELEKRSKLPPDHPQFILPSAIEELKKTQRPIGTPAASPPVAGATGTEKLSRSAYERTRVVNPTGSDRVDKNDHGIVECFEVWATLDPKEYEIYEDWEDSEPVKFQFLIANQSVLLNVSESTYAHGFYPYAVAEGRPSAQHQFSPSWMALLKGLQDYIDWLKNRHQEALSRTVGNIFIIDPSKVDIDDFLNPEKEGLIIPLKEEAAGQDLRSAVQQVPIKDLTENFHEEMMQFVELSEATSAATSAMQGQQDDKGSATEFAGTQQMSAGRLASVARLLSVQALVPQTKQIVANYQQFLQIPQALRFVSKSVDLPTTLKGLAAVVITRDNIQGNFEFIAHDGTLPGTDGRKVAAIAKILEAAQGFPQVFMPAPGNLDPRKLLFAGAKASGLNIENFIYDSDQAAAAAGPPPMPGAPPAGPGGPPPAGPAPQPPGPAPSNIAPPGLAPPGLPSASPLQVRPANA